MADGGSYFKKENTTKACICALLILIFFSGVIEYNIHDPPSFQLKKFYIPALDKSFNSSKNASIAFDISLTNKGSLAKLFFDPINVTFYDGQSQNHSIANFTIPEFSVNVLSVVDYSGMVNATGFDLDGAKREISDNGFKVFRVGLETSLRYDYFKFWKTKRYGYRKGVDVKIGETGAAAKFGNNFVGIRVLIIFNLMVLVFLCSY